MNFNKYDFIFFTGLLLWLIETWHFGFNPSPISVQEKMLDQLSIGIIGYGALCGIVASIKISTNFNINNNQALEKID